MKISKLALLAMNGSRTCKKRLAEELDVTENSIWRWISENEENGDLTKAKALQVIGEETGLSNDQILEEDRMPESVSKEPQS